jgi:hypothetical protein
MLWGVRRYDSRIMGYLASGRLDNGTIGHLKGVCHEISWPLFWHVCLDLGLYKNL